MDLFVDLVKDLVEVNLWIDLMGDVVNVGGHSGGPGGRPIV